MKPILKYVQKNPLAVLYLTIPIALLAAGLHWASGWVFALSALGVIPLAGLIGEATEGLAARTGPRIGGLLNATLGNAAELIITLVAVRAGLLDLVKASITGSIIGNLLLVLGFAMLLGGLKNGVQKFDRRQSTNHAVLLAIAVLALVIPSVFSRSITEAGGAKVEVLSLGVAAIMIALYVFGLVYSLTTNNSPISYPAGEEGAAQAAMPIREAILLLALATGGVVWLSELLVGAVEAVVANIGLSEFFLGIILIPVVGNVAEHLVAVRVARSNHMDLSVEIAVSSSQQVALFVAPLLVFISLAMGHPLTLIFNQFELLALGGAVLISALVSMDGESHWLEGVSLLSVYLILTLAFFLLPV